MKLEALDHPKTLDLAALLKVELPTVIGHLELLWAFTGKKSPQGDIGKWPDGAIARACCWMGDPGHFVKCLLESRLVDAHKTHRLVVHDWHDHAPGWVRAKLKKVGLEFIKPIPERTPERSLEPSSDQSLEPSIQVKGSTSTSEVKGSNTTSAAPTIDEPAWFDEFRSIYPPRAGDQGWRRAHKAARARQSEGYSTDEFIAGARRYAAFCEATNKIGTEYVKQAATFLGPDKPFLQAWAPPASKAQARQDKNLSASMQWLAAEEAKDATH